MGQLAKAAAKPRAKDLRSLLSVAALSQRDVLLEDILGQMQATVPAGPQQGGMGDVGWDVVALRGFTG